MKRALILTLVLSLTALAGPADSAQKPRLKPYLVFYGPDNACSNDGLVAFVNAKLDLETNRQARKVSAKYAPRGKATLTVAGLTYKLTPDRKSDSYSADFASWSFKPVKRASSSIVNKRAKLTYDTNAGTVRLSGKVIVGGCG